MALHRFYMKWKWNYSTAIINKIHAFKISGNNGDVKEGSSTQSFLQPSIKRFDNRLDVHLPRWPRTLHLSYIWLRDHCQCPQCINQKSLQKIQDFYTIKLNLQPKSISSNQNQLKVQWPDGHESHYDFKFLWQNTFEGKRTVLKENVPFTWTQTTFPSLDTLELSMGSFINHKNGLMKFIKSILKYGIGIVSEVPATIEDTRKVVEELCPIRKTFFGEMWSFQDDFEKSDTAYTNEYLGPHTDTTYYSEASRLQVFHSLQAANEGGETILVDGFNVAKQFKKEYPKGYDFLSTVPFPSEYIGDDQHLISLDFIFKHHPITKELYQFRYNIYDRAPLSTIPFERLQEFYEHFHNLTTIVRRPKNEVVMKLLPGQIMFLDNWRVLHGRTAYNGKRIMGGCYLSNSEFLSKARVLGINVD